jgi:hypothetical protein
MFSYISHSFKFETTVIEKKIKEIKIRYIPIGVRIGGLSPSVALTNFFSDRS